MKKRTNFEEIRTNSYKFPRPAYFQVFPIKSVASSNYFDKKKHFTRTNNCLRICHYLQMNKVGFDFVLKVVSNDFLIMDYYCSKLCETFLKYSMCYGYLFRKNMPEGYVFIHGYTVKN